MTWSVLEGNKFWTSRPRQAPSCIPAGGLGRTCRQATREITPGPSVVLPLKWGIVKLPGPAGRDPGVDFCCFLQLRGLEPQPCRGAARVWAFFAVKKPRKSRPRDPSRPVPEALSFPRLWETLLRGPFKGPRGPFKRPRGPLQGPRGPLKRPRGPFKGPRGPVVDFCVVFYS